MLKAFPSCASGVLFTSKTNTFPLPLVPSRPSCCNMRTGGCAGKRRQAEEELSGMDATPDFEKQMVIEEVRRFVDREVIPVARALEHDDIYPVELIEKLKRQGIFGVTIPEEYGGLGLDFVTYASIIEELSRGWMSLSGIVNTHLLVAYMIAAYGTQVQRARFLPVMAEGDRRAGLCLSEASGGSDVQAIQMTATREGDDYILNGSKLWVTNAINGSI